MYIYIIIPFRIDQTATTLLKIFQEYDVKSGNPLRVPICMIILIINANPNFIVLYYIGTEAHQSMALTLYKGHPVDRLSTKILRFTSDIQDVRLLMRSIPLSAIYQVHIALFIY